MQLISVHFHIKFLTGSDYRYSTISQKCVKIQFFFWAWFETCTLFHSVVLFALKLWSSCSLCNFHLKSWRVFVCFSGSGAFAKLCWVIEHWKSSNRFDVFIFKGFHRMYKMAAKVKIKTNFSWCDGRHFVSGAAAAVDDDAKSKLESTLKSFSQHFIYNSLFVLLYKHFIWS